MFSHVQLLPVGFSLAAVFAWGISDFVGGYAARRASAFLIAMLGHASGLLLMSTIALSTHATFPSTHSVHWALGAGLCGGAALAIFYRALASGSMGVTAAVSAVLGAAIPTIFGILTEGVPHTIAIAGFVLAGIGIWLICRTEDDKRPQGLGLAVLAGVGFAGFFLCIKEAGAGSAPWIAALSRAASLIVTGTIVLVAFGRNLSSLNSRSLVLGALAGCLDVTGSMLYVRASQTGRLDTAVVLTSLYPTITVLLAHFILKEHFTPWKRLGLVAALLAVPLIALQ
ncbi:MAG: DMT family transporter [Terriglobales bacterium]